MLLYGLILELSFLVALFIVCDFLFKLLVEKTTKLIKKWYSWYLDVVSNVNVHFTLLTVLFVCIFVYVVNELFE